MVPKTVKSVEHWKYCVERFSSPEFQEASRRNKANREKKKSFSTQGSKPFIAHRYEMKNKATGKLQSVVDNYEAQYKTKAGQWTNEAARVSYEQILEQRTQLTQQATQDGAEVDPEAIELTVMERVLGSTRDHCKGVGPTLPKLASMGAALSDYRAGPSQPYPSQPVPTTDPLARSNITQLASTFQAFIDQLKRANPNIVIPTLDTS